MKRIANHTLSLRAVTLTGLAFLLLATTADAQRGKKRDDPAPAEDPYADIVWPPPPDKARIKLERVLQGRADIEGESKFKRMLIGASPQGPYDTLKKPFGVDFDPEGRVLVTDWQTGALLRFDLEASKLDILGTTGPLQFRQPMGIDVAPDGTIFVADNAQAKIVGLHPDGKLAGVWGKFGELETPTDVALSPDGRRLYVTDAKRHKIVWFDRESGAKLGEFGKAGGGADELAFPNALTFTPDGDLLVVDQINARVKLLNPDGETIDSFGSRGLGFSQFVRPKDVVVDEVGFIYVTDFAFNNVQIFDADFTLLTYVGEGGESPGRFSGMSGVAVQGDRIALVDQLGHRLQLLRFVVPKTAE